VAIAKGSMFCLPQFIEPAAAEIFRQLRQEKFLQGLARDVFVDRMTYYLGEVNAVHPFRDGNGRTQRAFFEQLAADAGYTLIWQRLDAERNVMASDAIMRGDPGPMREMLDELIHDHQPGLPGWSSAPCAVGPVSPAGATAPLPRPGRRHRGAAVTPTTATAPLLSPWRQCLAHRVHDPAAATAPSRAQSTIAGAIQ
jgi:cell filamentation protein